MPLPETDICTINTVKYVMVGTCGWSSSMKRISIIEDEPDIANLVARNLRKEQFEISVFHDGESFLRSLDDELPDLAILDLMLPGIAPLEAKREALGVTLSFSSTNLCQTS